MAKTNMSLTELLASLLTVQIHEDVHADHRDRSDSQEKGIGKICLRENFKRKRQNFNGVDDDVVVCIELFCFSTSSWR